MSEYQLSLEITKLSRSGTWNDAKLEWDLLNVYKESEPDRCLCGHYPINEICEIKNRENSIVTIVGNCCVKKFLNLGSSPIFQSLRNINKSIEKSLNADTLLHAYERKWIKDWDYDFYNSIIRKRKLSDKQLSHKKRINKIIKNRLTNTRKSSSDKI